MNLVIDIGNTLIKTAIFRGEELHFLHTGSTMDDVPLEQIIGRYKPGAAIVSSVRGTTADPGKSPASAGDGRVAASGNTQATDVLKASGIPVLMAGTHLKIPLMMRYGTPETLGSDRLAAAVAAAGRFPGQNSMVIMAGSCLTTEFVTDKNEYLGGTIAPGLSMRFQAMHRFTGQLPLITDTAGDIPLTGNTTEKSMLSGVINGMTAEIEGLIIRKEYETGPFNVILTGGDAKVFAKRLKNRIFAQENFVLQGLNIMLRYNVEHPDLP